MPPLPLTDRQSHASWSGPPDAAPAQEDVYCIDILTQVSALTSALENVALGLLDDHLHHCVLDAAGAGGDEAEIKLKEASAAVKRLVKS